MQKIGKFFEKIKGQKWIQIRYKLSKALTEQKAGKLLAAVNSYLCVAKLFARAVLIELKLITPTDWENSHKTRSDGLPEKYFRVNHQTHVIYCPIPKIASSTLLTQLILENNSSAVSKQISDTHEDSFRYCSLNSYVYEDAMALLQDKRYLKCVFVRNPWSRLLSAYLNKLVEKRNEYKSKRLVVDLYKNKELVPNDQKSITFRQFVECIVTSDERELNYHWLPQYLFLGEHQFDFIGKYEDFSADFERLKQKLQLANLELIKKNSTHYSEPVIQGDKAFCDYYPHELRELTGFPDYKHFYTAELKECVARYYQKDIELFGYTFDS